MIIITKTMNAQEQLTLNHVKDVLARGERQSINVPSMLQSKATTFGDGTWEVMLMIAQEAAKMLKQTAMQEFDGDDEVQRDVVAPLTTFVESLEAQPASWLSHSAEGSAISAELAEALLKALRLLQGNASLRLKLLAEVNKSLEKSVMMGGVKVVIDTKVSVHTHQPLKPLSKRDLTAQIMRAVMFLTENPGGFTIH